MSSDTQHKHGPGVISLFEPKRLLFFSPTSFFLSKQHKVGHALEFVSRRDLGETKKNQKTHTVFLSLVRRPDACFLDHRFH